MRVCVKGRFREIDEASSRFWKKSNPIYISLCKTQRNNTRRHTANTGFPFWAVVWQTFAMQVTYFYSI